MTERRQLILRGFSDQAPDISGPHAVMAGQHPNGFQMSGADRRCLHASPARGRGMLTLVVEIIERGGKIPPDTQIFAEAAFFVMAGSGCAIADGTPAELAEEDQAVIHQTCRADPISRGFPAVAVRRWRRGHSGSIRDQSPASPAPRRRAGTVPTQLVPSRAKTVAPVRTCSV